MFCSNCGNEVPDDAKVCPECGQDLSYESHQIRQHNKKNPKKKRGSKAAAVFITVIVVIAVFEGLWFFGPLPKFVASFSRSGKADSKASPNGGVTSLISGTVSENAASSGFSLIDGSEPTPTPTVTPVANLPEVSASVVETPTPTPTPEPSKAPQLSPSPAPSAAPGTDSSYIIAGSDSTPITEQQLAGMDAATIRLARNEIYARHGLIFKSKDLQDYFSKKSWYHGTVSSSSQIALNDTERKNLATISAYEAAHKG